jgi:hypothetical protein
MLPGMRRITDWMDEPVPALRLELVRILAPLAILGFMSGRLAHADEWIGDAGFHVPDLGGDWRQPLFLSALPPSAAWFVAFAMIASGLACSLGWRTRPCALIFATTLAYVAVADRLAAFTVSKLSPAIMMAVAAGPAGTRLGIDAWRQRRTAGESPAWMQPSGSVRFLQALPVVIYSASGIAKVKGDWLTHPLVLWSHVHDSYQTPFAFAVASALPAWTWTAFQGMVLLFEVFAPLWFALRRARPFAAAFGLGMHLMIGLMFGPVVWFALLMATLLAAGHLPDSLILALDGLAQRLCPQFGQRQTERKERP